MSHVHDRHQRLPRGWRALSSDALTDLLAGLSDSDADMVDAELASRQSEAA